MSNRRRALIISNDEPDSDYGARHLAAAFSGSFETRIVNPLGGFARPSSWLEDEGADALVLSGSDRSVTLGLPWMLEEEEILRAAVRDRVPTLAVCFGHQLLAKAFGAEIVRKEKRVGLFEVRPVTDDPLFSGLGPAFIVPQQHGDHVSRAPEGFVVIATSDYCPVQALKHDRAPVYGIQFHPCYDETVFDADETWAGLGRPERFAHDGPRLLRNAVRVFSEILA